MWLNNVRKMLRISKSDCINKTITEAKKKPSGRKNSIYWKIEDFMAFAFISTI